MNSSIPQNLFTLLKNTLFIGILLIGIQSANAQSVGINTLTPDPSAALDIQSTTGGLLIPRMTTAEIDALTSPADGLMIFNTDINNSIMFVQGAPYELYNTAATSALTILSGLVPSVWLGISTINPTDLLGLETYRFQLDLRDVKEMRVVANVTGLSLSTGTELNIALQYSTDGGTTWSYLNGTSFGPGISISVNGLVTTPWVEIDAAAKQDVQLRIVGTSNSLISLQVGFGLLITEMR